MNKTVLWVVILLVLGLLAFVFLNRDETEGTEPELESENSEMIDEAEDVDTEAQEDEVDTDAVRARLESATVVVPDLDVEATLEAGETTFDAGGIVPTEGLVILGENFTVVELGGETYVLAHVSFNTGGTGVFDYLVSFRDTGTELEQVDAEILGDRIIVEAVEAGNVTDDSAQVTVDVLIRGEGEPLAVTPSIEETAELTINAEGELAAS